MTKLPRRILAFLFIAISASAQASAGSPFLQSRVSQLLRQSNLYKADGPNCYASVLYSVGLIDDWAHVDHAYRTIVASPYCIELPSLEEARSGDIFTIEGHDARDTGGITHTALFVSKNRKVQTATGRIFAKMGYSKRNATEVMDARENIRIYLSGAHKLCREQASNPAVLGQCLATSLFPRFYRCDFNRLKADMGAMPAGILWGPLLAARAELARATLEKKLDRAALARAESELKTLATSMLSMMDSSRRGVLSDIYFDLIDDALTQIDLLKKDSLNP